MFGKTIGRVAGTAVSALALGIAVSVPALAAPSAGPTAPTSIAPSSSVTQPQTKTTQPTTKPRQTTSKPATQAPAGSFKSSFTAPGSATGSAVIRVTGAKPGQQFEAWISTAAEKHQPHSTASAYADAKGNATLYLKPDGKWLSGTTYIWRVGYQEFDSGVFTTANWAKTTKPADKATASGKKTSEKDSGGGLASTGF